VRRRAHRERLVHGRVRWVARTHPPGSRYMMPFTPARKFSAWKSERPRLGKFFAGTQGSPSRHLVPPRAGSKQGSPGRHRPDALATAALALVRPPLGEPYPRRRRSMGHVVVFIRPEQHRPRGGGLLKTGYRPATRPAPRCCSCALRRTKAPVRHRTLSMHVRENLARA